MVNKADVFLVTETANGKGYFLQNWENPKVVITKADGPWETPDAAREVALKLGFITQDVDGW